MKKSVKVFAAALLIGSTCCAAAGDGYAKNFTITPAPALGLSANSALADFPLLVRLSPGIDGFSYGDFRNAALGSGEKVPSGLDILFSDENGTKLSYEIQAWNTAGTSLVWVRVPSLTPNTRITCSYGRDGAGEANDPTDAWRAYAGAWHFDEVGVGGTSADSTANGFTAKCESATAWTTGLPSGAGDPLGAGGYRENDGKREVGAGDFANGTGSGVVFSGTGMLHPEDGTHFTASAWFRRNTTDAGWDHLFYKKNSSSGYDTDGNDWGMEMNGYAAANLFVFGRWEANTTKSAVEVQHGIEQADVWYHLAIVYDGFNRRVYRNGELLSSGDLPSDRDWALPQWVREDLDIALGNDSDQNDSTFHGAFDEARLRLASYNADWARAEYATMASADSLSYSAVSGDDPEEPSGRVLYVGADKEYKKPSEAINAAQAGDTIVIDEGVWTDDTIYCPNTPDITIRGAGIDKTVLDASGLVASTYPSDEPHIAGWKGIWVITAANWTVEGITFRNARIPDGAGHNGAGIRFEPWFSEEGGITIRGCSFTGCQNGILCGAFPNATMTIEECVFRGNGNREEWGGSEGNTHNLYIGDIKELVFRNCVSDHAWKGHNLKSRARKTTIENSVFDDGHDGRSSYLVNCPNGGIVTITGCKFVQSETAENGIMVSIGEEGAYSQTKLTQYGNTFVNYREAGYTEWRLDFPAGLNDTPVWEYGSYEPSEWRPSAENALFGAETSKDQINFYAGDTLANNVASLTDGYIPSAMTASDVVGIGDYSNFWFPLAGEKLKSLTIRSLWEDGTHDGMYVRCVQLQIDGKWCDVAGGNSGVPTGDCGRNGYDDASGWTSAVKLGGENSSGHLFLRLKPETEDYIAENVTGIHIEFRVMDGYDPRGTGIVEVEADCVTGRKSSGIVTYSARGVTVVETGRVFMCAHPAEFTLESDQEVKVERIGANGATVSTETQTWSAGTPALVTVRAGESARVTLVNVEQHVARVLYVGANQKYKKPSEAITAALDGDTIVIDEGVWTDDTIYCPDTPNITIRGAGIDKTILDASAFDARYYGDPERPHIAGWKGIWVVTAPGWTIEGITFRNARIPDDAGHNGAGLRYEADGDVTIRNCSFTGSQNGILCGAFPNATMTVEGCFFRGNGNRAEWGGMEGDTHNIYIGAIKELIFRDCISDHAWIGHNLKSRAHRTTVENCVFDDGHDGRSSYLLNCPNGGAVTITGCTFVQAETAANGVMIAIGEEGAYPRTSLTEHDNTFIDYRGGTVWRLDFPVGICDLDDLAWEYGSYDPATWVPSAENGLFGARTSTDNLSYFAGDSLANDVASLTDGFIPPAKTATDVVGLGDYSHLWFPLGGEKLKSLTIRSLWDDGKHDGMYVRSVQVQVNGAWRDIAGGDTGVPTGDCGRDGYDDASGWTSAVKMGGSNSSGHLFLRLAPKSAEYIAENVTGIHVEFRMMDGSDPRGTGFVEVEADCVTGRKTSGSVTYTDRGVSVVEEGRVFECTHTADFTLDSDMQVTVERFAASGAQIASETKTFGAGTTVTAAVRAGERARVTLAKASVLAVECDSEELSAEAKDRIRALVAGRLGAGDRLQVTGPKGVVALSAWMGIAPSISDDSKGVALATYTMPTVSIVEFDPASGRMRIRIDPGKDNELAMPVDTKFIHVFGSENLTSKMGYVSSVDFDASQYLASGTKGELDATVALARRRFLKVVVESEARSEGETE